MARGKKGAPPDDDGRTVANMNVEGMPWYTPTPDDDIPRVDESETLSREDRRRYILGAVLAALVVVAVFGLAIFLFITFCDFVWFR